jgi:hypothetical protein
MTAPSQEKRDREKDKLFVTDAELIRKLGVPEKHARRVIQALDENRPSGFPPKQTLWADRRYWPAVKAWLDKNYGLSEQEQTLPGPPRRLALEASKRAGMASDADDPE